MLACVGTSGWNYDHWKGLFYPAGLPRSRWLDHYASTFTTVEVNATFYRQVGAGTFEKWRSGTPDGFVWAVKAHRFITHTRRLSGVEGPVKTFLDAACNLGDKLGPILFQLPPSLAFDARTAAAFFSLLPEGLRYVLEARHASWTAPDALAMLEGHGIAWCISDTAGRYLCLEALTAPFTYLRLHGSRRLYASEYSPAEISGWAEKIRAWNLPAYVYFDNDYMAYAVKNALEMREELSRDGEQ
ncbi:MAG TPA: DUF72 domain-containing protein [Deltaproteobacteria bacterium]|jgi:uncharacterized protein YecE (DUF72 family)|nr:DUF72 domain-containing protein [Deltaproteobacteria bacterium]HOI07368.1 DUF72 domain-containing protein [Deltaproteobacteria bacterium]